MEEFSLEHARALDEADPLNGFRRQFHFPTGDRGRPKVYLCGHSLGLQPAEARRAVVAELDDWERLGVAGHFAGEHPWMPYHEFVTAPLAGIVGALRHEVVAMNSLTVNLHLMMVSFYRPRDDRYRIVMERQAFPSDQYAVASQVSFHGYDPANAVVQLEDAPDSASVSLETLEDYLRREGERVALILMPGLQYLSGQLQDLRGVCRLGREYGCVVGLDLAHAVGNVPLALHEWGPDFAVWCSYKYLNCGPGAVAGCFVHDRHANDSRLPRFAGWWGHDKASRFRMGSRFEPSPGAEGWQLSNPPILALAPLRASLPLFSRAGMDRLREKSIRLTGYLEAGLGAELDQAIEVRTPANPAQRGCQLSLRLRGDAARGREVFRRLEAADVVVDWREPDVIRVAPTPMYNRFQDVVQFVDRLKSAIGD